MFDIIPLGLERLFAMRLKGFFYFCAVYLALPIALLLSLEVALRVALHMKHSVPGKSYGTYVYDKDVGARLKPNGYNSGTSYNNLGFRNLHDIHPGKLLKGKRIYCTGGSTTYCQNLDTPQTWPHLLQERLRTHPGHPHDEVINSGIMSVPLSYEFKLAQKWIPILKPDYVIFYGTGFNEDRAEIELERAGYNLDEMARNRKDSITPDEVERIKKYFSGQ